MPFWANKLETEIKKIIRNLYILTEINKNKHSKVKKILHLSKFFFTFVSYIKKNYKNDLLIKFIVVIFCKIIYINDLRLIN